MPQLTTPRVPRGRRRGGSSGSHRGPHGTLSARRLEPESPVASRFEIPGGSGRVAHRRQSAKPWRRSVQQRHQRLLQRRVMQTTQQWSPSWPMANGWEKSVRHLWQHFLFLFFDPFLWVFLWLFCCAVRHAHATADGGIAEDVRSAGVADWKTSARGGTERTLTA